MVSDIQIQTAFYMNYSNLHLLSAKEKLIQIIDIQGLLFIFSLNPLLLII